METKGKDQICSEHPETVMRSASLASVWNVQPFQKSPLSQNVGDIPSNLQNEGESSSGMSFGVEDFPTLAKMTPEHKRHQSKRDNAEAKTCNVSKKRKNIQKLTFGLILGNSSGTVSPAQPPVREAKQDLAETVTESVVQTPAADQVPQSGEVPSEQAAGSILTILVSDNLENPQEITFGGPGSEIPSEFVASTNQSLVENHCGIKELHFSTVQTDQSQILRHKKVKRCTPLVPIFELPFEATGESLPGSNILEIPSKSEHLKIHPTFGGPESEIAVENLASSNQPCHLAEKQTSDRPEEEFQTISTEVCKKSENPENPKEITFGGPGSEIPIELVTNTNQPSKAVHRTTKGEIDEDQKRTKQGKRVRRRKPLAPIFEVPSLQAADFAEISSVTSGTLNPPMSFGGPGSEIPDELISGPLLPVKPARVQLEENVSHPSSQTEVAKFLPGNTHQSCHQEESQTSEHPVERRQKDDTKAERDSAETVLSAQSAVREADQDLSVTPTDSVVNISVVDQVPQPGETIFEQAAGSSMPAEQSLQTSTKPLLENETPVPQEIKFFYEEPVNRPTGGQQGKKRRKKKKRTSTEPNFQLLLESMGQTYEDFLEEFPELPRLSTLQQKGESNSGVLLNSEEFPALQTSEDHESERDDTTTDVCKVSDNLENVQEITFGGPGSEIPIELVTNTNQPSKAVHRTTKGEIDGDQKRTKQGKRVGRRKPLAPIFEVSSLQAADFAEISSVTSGTMNPPITFGGPGSEIPDELISGPLLPVKPARVQLEENVSHPSSQTEVANTLPGNTHQSCHQEESQTSEHPVERRQKDDTKAEQDSAETVLSAQSAVREADQDLSVTPTDSVVNISVVDQVPQPGETIFEQAAGSSMPAEQSLQTSTKPLLENETPVPQEIKFFYEEPVNRPTGGQQGKKRRKKKKRSSTEPNLQTSEDHESERDHTTTDVCKVSDNLENVQEITFGGPGSEIPDELISETLLPTKPVAGSILPTEQSLQTSTEPASVNETPVPQDTKCLIEEPRGTEHQRRRKQRKKCKKNRPLEPDFALLLESMGITYEEYLDGVPLLPKVVKDPSDVQDKAESCSDPLLDTLQTKTPEDHDNCQRDDTMTDVSKECENLENPQTITFGGPGSEIPAEIHANTNKVCDQAEEHREIKDLHIFNMQTSAQGHQRKIKQPNKVERLPPLVPFFEVPCDPINEGLLESNGPENTSMTSVNLETPPITFGSQIPVEVIAEPLVLSKDRESSHLPSETEFIDTLPGNTNQSCHHAERQTSEHPVDGRQKDDSKAELDSAETVLSAQPAVREADQDLSVTPTDSVVNMSAIDQVPQPGETLSEQAAGSIVPAPNTAEQSAHQRGRKQRKKCKKNRPLEPDFALLLESMSITYEEYLDGVPLLPKLVQDPSDIQDKAESCSDPLLGILQTRTPEDHNDSQIDDTVTDICKESENLENPQTITFGGPGSEIPAEIHANTNKACDQAEEQHEIKDLHIFTIRTSAQGHQEKIKQHKKVERRPPLIPFFEVPCDPIHEGLLESNVSENTSMAFENLETPPITFGSQIPEEAIAEPLVLSKDRESSHLPSETEITDTLPGNANQSCHQAERQTPEHHIDRAQKDLCKMSVKPEITSGNPGLEILIPSETVVPIPPTEPQADSIASLSAPPATAPHPILKLLQANKPTNKQSVNINHVDEQNIFHGQGLMMIPEHQFNHILAVNDEKISALQKQHEDLLAQLRKLHDQVHKSKIMQSSASQQVQKLEAELLEERNKSKLAETSLSQLQHETDKAKTELSRIHTQLQDRRQDTTKEKTALMTEVERLKQQMKSQKSVHEKETAILYAQLRKKDQLQADVSSRVLQLEEDLSAEMTRASRAETCLAQEVEETSRMKSALVKTQDELNKQKHQWQRHKNHLMAEQQETRACLERSVMESERDLHDQEKQQQDEKLRLLETIYSLKKALEEKEERKRSRESLLRRVETLEAQAKKTSATSETHHMRQ